ncbi:MAG: HesA/MoeB/ThiF family protein [Alistipes indistinctus]
MGFFIFVVSANSRMELSAAQRERYERNLLVEGFTDRMQQALIAARVAVVGAGGLGSAALNYLVAAGVGHLTLIENDTVSLSNLQRQVLYTTADMGRPKAEVAAMRLSRLNPGCDIRVVTDRLTAANAAGLLGGHDAVVDCTDNYDARYVIDDFCREAEVLAIYGIPLEAVGGRWPFSMPGGAGGYRDLYPGRASQKPVVGVLSPIVGVIGSLQALETVKLLCGVGESLAGNLLVVDGRTMQVSKLEL